MGEKCWESGIWNTAQWVKGKEKNARRKRNRDRKGKGENNNKSKDYIYKLAPSAYDDLFSFLFVGANKKTNLDNSTCNCTIGRIVLKSTHRPFFDLLPNEPKLIILVVRPQEHMFEPYLPPFSIIKDTLRVLRCGFFEKREISWKKMIFPVHQFFHRKTIYYQFHCFG